MHNPECLKPLCTLGEAVATQMSLEEAGIPCRVCEELGGIWGGQAGGLGSARVLVAREDLRRAAEVLRTREQTVEADASLGDSNDEEDDYWNTPEAFAAFEDDDGKRSNELQPWALIVFGPFWMVYFIVVLGLFATLGYLLVSDIMGF